MDYSDFVCEDAGSGKRINFTQNLKDAFVDCLCELAHKYRHSPSLNPAKSYLSVFSEKNNDAQGRFFDE